MSTNIKLSNSQTVFTWQIALLLLSLERVAPFWSDVGLTFQEVVLTRDAIRSYVLQQQRYDDQEEDDLGYAERTGSFITVLIEGIAAIEGEAATLTLLAWVARTELFESESWRGVWRVLLIRLTRFGAPLLQHRGLSHASLKSLIELGEAWGQADAFIGDRVERADAEALEGWDEEQYKRYRREGFDISPLDFLLSYLRNDSFDQVWRQMVQVLGPSGMEILNACGQIESAVNTSVPASLAEIPQKYRSL